ncbi:MAG: transposase, partial [Nitrososphaerota archaeon]|nr:transposase [Nitrososphaerota archaeon]
MTQGGALSECPVSGEKLKRPAWEESRCKTCGVTCDRNRVASLAIVGRGLRLCGYQFTVSADASWTPMKDEYLYVSHRPDMAAAGRTEESNAPMGIIR